MIGYFVRRVLSGLATLILITMVVYALIRAMPGDPTLTDMESSEPGHHQSQEQALAERKEIGLDDPWPMGYWNWISHAARLDLQSSFTRKPSRVTELIAAGIGPTLILSTISTFLAFVIAIPLGLYFTAHNGRWDERLLSTFLYMLYSLPVFVAALLLQMYFSVKLDLLPLNRMIGDHYEDLSLWGKVWDLTRHALLPVLCETYGVLAYYSRFVHSNMQEVIRQDYIRTARAKGVGPRRVIVHHAFRNALIPLVTLFGLTLPALLGGAVILEQIFSWPGIGNLFYESIERRDYPTIMGLVLMFSVLTLLGQLLADLLYGVVDPRVGYS